MKKYFFITVVFLISSIYNIFIRDVAINIAFGAILFQFFGSMILGYVVSMFVSKYKENNWTRYWKIIYVAMVIINLIAYFLDFMPPASSGL